MSQDDWMRIKVAELQGKMEREAMRKLLREEADKGTRRYLRARRTANEMLSLFREFIPERMLDEAYDEALLSAFWCNAEIIQVPPECDEMDKRALEMRMLEAYMKPLQMIVPKTI